MPSKAAASAPSSVVVSGRNYGETMIPQPYGVLDIETAANSRAADYYRTQTYEAPSNWKDPAKIAEYKLQARHKDMRKAALYWWTGRVTAASVDPLNCQTPRFCDAADDEKALLIRLFTHLQRLPTPAVVTGKNTDEFDKPFLVGRALVYDIGIPDCLRTWRKIDDIDLIFGNRSVSSQVSKLSDYAFGLDIAPKLNDGRGAIELWLLHQDGDQTALEALKAHNMRDCEIVTELLRRYSKPFSPADLGPAIEEPLDIPFG